MTVLAQTLLALVGRHLMSLLFLSVRHGVMFYRVEKYRVIRQSVVSLAAPHGGEEGTAVRHDG